jgi:integrase
MPSVPEEGRTQRRRSTPSGIRRVDRKAKPWQAFVFDAKTGKKVRRHFATLEEAKAWRASSYLGVKAGSVTASRKPRLDAAADALIAGMEDGSIRARGGGQYRASVCRKYRLCLDGYVLDDLGAYRLDRITHPMLLDHAERLLARGLAPGTIRNAFDPLRVIFKRAVARGIISANPAAGLELPGGDQKPRERVAGPAEAERLVAALAAPRDRALWAAALYAGLRAGELRALKWRHVDIDASRITICQSMDDRRATGDPKSRAGTRRVPITLHLRRQLSALQAETVEALDAYVFGEAPDRAFAPTSIYRRARADWAAASVEPITLHECRHSCLSTWIASGVNIKVASTMAGHASIAITLDRYGHLMPGAEDEALAQIEKWCQSGASRVG